MTYAPLASAVAVIMVLSVGAKAVSTVEVVPDENGADRCIMQKIGDANAAIAIASRRVEGAQFAAIKQACAAETHERPKIWENTSGLIIAPLLRRPPPFTPSP